MDDKVTLIMSVIANNMDIFLCQAKYKLLKHRHLLNSDDDYKELVSDVTFSILDKLDKVTYIDKYYIMAMNNKLHLYVLKSIDMNCKSFRAPFLRSKLQYKKFDELPEMISHDVEPMDDVTKIYETLSIKNQENILYVYSMFEPKMARQLFGPHWKYFVSLFLEYIDEPDTTYKSIGDKYGIPLSSISSHINIVKNIIKNKIKEKENEKNI